jgi:hypothetical protein
VGQESPLVLFETYSTHMISSGSEDHFGKEIISGLHASHWRLINLNCFTDPSTAPVIQRVDVMNSTLVKVTWSSIPKETVHGLLRGYQVGTRLIFFLN